MTNYYYFEVTDTYGSEANYSWVKRFKISANTIRGALIKLSKEMGLNWRFDGLRYNAKNACICAYDISDYEGIEDTYTFKQI